MITKQGELTTLERAMADFFRADSIDEIGWANGNYERHGRYLIAMWFGMDKEEAYAWVRN